MRLFVNNRALAAAALTLVAGLAQGCGWTPRDEFQLHRSVSVKAKPGDGSETSYRWNAQESLAARRIGAEIAAGPRP